MENESINGEEIKIAKYQEILSRFPRGEIVVRFLQDYPSRPLAQEIREELDAYLISSAERASLPQGEGNLMDIHKEVINNTLEGVVSAMADKVSKEIIL